MACNKKIYTYGSKKKEEKDNEPWTGVLKGDACSNQPSKRLTKKSVWAKAPGKPVQKVSNKHNREEPDDPFGFIDDDKKTVFPGLEKHKMPTTTIYGSPNNKHIKSRIEGKILPQTSVTINAQDLKLYGSPRKSDMNSKTTEGEGSKCDKAQVQSSESATNDTKTSELKIDIKCDDLCDIKRTKTHTNDSDEKSCVSPNKKPMNIKAVVSISPNKTKPINIKPVVRVTKLNRDKCKILEKGRNLIESVKPEKPVKPAKPGKSQLKCGSIPVQFIDDNTVLIIRQKETNKKGKKKQRTRCVEQQPIKNKNVKEDKQVLEDGNIFNILSNENHCLAGKQETSEKNEPSKKTIEENHLLVVENDKGKVESEDEYKYSDEDEDKDLSENELEKNKLLPDVDDSEDDMTLQSIIEDGMPLKTLIEDDMPLKSLITRSGISPNKSPNKSPVKRSVRRKRSLFSYYDKLDNKTNSISNNNLKEFDFPSEADDISDFDDKPHSSSTNLLSREYSDDFTTASPVSKKNKLDDLPHGSMDDFVEKDSCNLVEKIHPNASIVKSPFKSKKSSSGLLHMKSDRRFSSLPTDITLESDDDSLEDSLEAEIVNTPPPLYRSSIFGFRKSGAASDHKVRVRRDEKELYTVVRNTKHAHECLEYGQTQQFKDDLEYLLDGLKSTHNVSTRCLSALELASKCISPEFRMHIKAHGIIENIFIFLEDAFSEEQLLLCASMIMYVLAKDKLKINFNKRTIGFMLKVITKKRTDFSTNPPNEKMVKKIRTIFEKVEDLDIDIETLETLDATVLAREALLSLTVKRTGEWFKDVIRELGGLDDLADTVYSCGQCIQKQKNVDESCIRMKRCLALFTDMSYKSTANQAYLLACRNSVVIESCIRTLYTITTNLDKEITAIVGECLMSIQLLLMNLSHENTNACIKICKQDNGLDSILRSSLHLSKYLPLTMAYENTIVSLCLLINLIAHHPQNKIILNKKMTIGYYGILSTDKICEDKHLKPVQALMQMFSLHSEACKEADLMQELEKLEKEESEHEAAKHYQEDEYALTCGDKFEDTIDEENLENLATEEPKKDVDGPLNETEKRDIKSTLDKAQRHMEDSHLAAYTAVLIGLLMEDDVENQELVHSLLPDGDFIALQESIEKILSFMEMTNPLSKSDQDCMKRIIQVIHNCNERFKEKG